MIITKLEGGMGNQMFQYAVGRSLAIKNKTSLGLYLDALLDRPKNVIHTYRNYDLDIYNINVKIVKRSEVPLMYKYCKRTLGGFFLRAFRFSLRKIFSIKLSGKDSEYYFNDLIFSLGENAFLEGCWQDEKYFMDIRDILLKDFELKNKPIVKIQKLTEQIIDENSLCLHVRRGDYIGDKNFENVNHSYYEEALEYFNNKVLIDKIYIFSDDIKWCEENLKFNLPVMFVGDEYSGSKAEGHHLLMRSCKYFIIPNSTYAWWAAWLSDRKDKIVIAPKQWFPDGSVHFGKYKNIVPQEWVKI